MKELRTDFSKAKVCLNNSQYEDFRAILHKIKGSALSFGIKELAERIQEIRSEIIAKQYSKAKFNMIYLNELINVMDKESKKYES